MEMKVGIAQGYFEADAPRCPLEVLKLPPADAASLERVASDALSAHLRHAEPPQVIIGWVHTLRAALQACAAAGLRVPEDTGLVGLMPEFGVADAALPSDELTAVLGDNQRIGLEAALMLAHMIREGHRRLAGRYIPGTLRIGASPRMSEATWRSLNEYAWTGGPRLERGAVTSMNRAFA
jgi:DNA-binding LacI/PurR family transcriptional regulator